MREAHCHIMSLGESLRIPDLAACTSLEECLDRVIEARRRSRASTSWIRLTGARTEAWPEARWPTIEELDRAAGDAPCVIMSFDHHAAACNSAALLHAGLAPGDRVPPSGVVVTNKISGRATGLLLEHAAYRVWGAAPEPSSLERTEIVNAALQSLAAHGFTEAHDLHSQSWLGPTLADLERNGRLPIRVWLYAPIARIESDFTTRAQWSSANIRLAGAKVFADGTLNSRTAMVLRPYAEPFTGPGCGPLGTAMVTPAELDTAIQTVERLGLHIAVHAIGDSCVRVVLDAIERSSRTPISSRGHHRIEHCELIDEADVPRFSQLGVVCSVQPCHLLTDIEVLRRQLPHSLHRVLPLREMINAGCRPGELLWFGSDAPIVRANPSDSIQAALHRRRVGMAQADAIGWDQRLSEAEARACFAPGGIR